MSSSARGQGDERGRKAEEEFFHREDQRLIERLRALKAKETARDSLSKASGITNAAVLDKLLMLEIPSETVAALSVVPLVEVAWADGSLDAKERAAVLAHVADAGFAPGSAEHVLLEAWLQKRPDPKLLVAWTHLVEGMCEKLSPDEMGRMKSTLLERARSVARASGGTLGLGSKVSKTEAAMLSNLESAFHRAS